MSCLELYKNAFVAVLEAFIVAWSESLHMMSFHAWVSANKTHDSAQSRFTRESTAITKNRRMSTEFTALQRGAEGPKPLSVKEFSAVLGCRSGDREPNLI